MNTPRTAPTDAANNRHYAISQECCGGSGGGNYLGANLFESLADWAGADTASQQFRLWQMLRGDHLYRNEFGEWTCREANWTPPVAAEFLLANHAPSPGCDCEDDQGACLTRLFIHSWVAPGPPGVYAH